MSPWADPVSRLFPRVTLPHLSPTESDFLLHAAGGVRLRPTLVTYNTLMSACGKGAMYEEADELYEAMLRQVGPMLTSRGVGAVMFALHRGLGDTKKRERGLRVPLDCVCIQYRCTHLCYAQWINTMPLLYILMP